MTHPGEGAHKGARREDGPLSGPGASEGQKKVMLITGAGTGIGAAVAGRAAGGGGGPDRGPAGGHRRHRPGRGR